MNILFCNFDIEIWRTDLLFKLVNELDSRGHSCHYYNYKHDISEVAKTFSTALQISDFPETDESDFEASKELIYNAASYSFGLNKRKKNSKDKDLQTTHLIRSFISSTHQVQKQVQADLIIVWGGFRYKESSIIAYAKAMGINIVIFEYGYFRPYTLTVESTGLNYNNSLPRDAEFYLNKYKDIEVSKSNFKELVSPKSAVFEDISASLKSSFPSRKKSINATSLVKLKNLIAKKIRQTSHKKINLNQRYIFVPFQVETDSQIIEFSNKIKSMKNLVAIVSEAVEQYNAKFNDDIKVIFKPHPVDKSVNIDYIMRHLDVYSNSLISFREETLDLINHSQLVITINSTVGIEGLIHGKNVITLGSAFYNIDGLVDHCEDYDNLYKHIKNSLGKEQNFDLVFKYIKYLREEYFSEIYYEGADKKSVANLCDRLEKVD